MDILTREEMQKLDAKSIAAGISSLTLMENAGRAVTKILLQNYLKKKESVLIVCGMGNNGGDGLVVARLLFQKKISVTVFIVGDEKKLKGDAFIQYKKCPKKIPIFFVQDKKDLKTVAVKPRATNEIANADPALLALCPLHITLTHKTGVSTVYFVRPSVVAAGSPGEAQAKKLEADIVKLIEGIMHGE